MMSTRFLILAGALSTGSLLLAQGPAGEAAAGVKRPGPRPVVFKVTAAGSGKPVSGVRVMAGARYQFTGADGAAVIDGMPSGKWKVQVAHPDYARLTRDLVLADGARPDVPLSLQPVEWVSQKGSVALTEEAGPLAGARIVFIPKAVPGPFIGSMECASDFDGNFEVPCAPQGIYLVEIKAPGCEPGNFEIELKKGAPPVAWTLAPITAPASLLVHVVDRATQSRLPGAKVTVMEAEGQGIIATGDAAAGDVSFPGLRTGVRNRQRTDGSAIIARNQVLVMASAPGYETWIAPATLSAGAETTIFLNSAAVIDAVEGDNQIAAAQPARTGAPLRMSMQPLKDQDWFRFRLPSAARVEVFSPGARPVELQVRLRNSAGQEFANGGFGPGNVLSLWNRGLQPGEYFLGVEEWANDAASPQAFDLTVRATPAGDAFEPNDTQDTARPVRLGSEVSGCIFPLGDADWFRFDVRRPGLLRVHDKGAAFERLLSIYDAKGRIAHNGYGPGNNVDTVVQVSPGSHWVRLEEWATDNESLVPYRLRLDMVEDDFTDDPAPVAGAVSALRHLNPGSFAATTLWPPGDRDSWQIAIPSAGRLRVFSTGPGETHLRIMTPAGKDLHVQGNGPRNHAVGTVDFAGPATCVAELSEWAGGDASPVSCAVWSYFEPADESEQAGRNDTWNLATPALLREPIRGSFLPHADADFFSLQLDHPGVLHLNGSSSTEFHIALKDARGNDLATQGCGSGAIHAEWPMLPGSYLLKFEEWANDVSTPVPWLITPVLVRAEPEESVPLNNDPVRRLRPNEAAAWLIDQRGDIDHFVLDIPAAGKWSLRLAVPGEVRLVMTDDRSGAVLHTQGLGVGNHVLPFEAKGPSRYRLALEEWAHDAVYSVPAFVLADTSGAARDMPREFISAKADATAGTVVTFRREGWKGSLPAASAEVDADGDGKMDFTMNGPAAQWTYAEEGLYRASALLHGAGVNSRLSFWVEAIGPRERKGVHLTVSRPSEGQVMERPETVTARAFSYSGQPVRRVDVGLDGKPLASGFTSPFDVDLPYADISAGPHKLTFTAVDGAGERAEIVRNFSVSDYFDLQPADGAVVTGNNIRVSWTGRGFGAGSVRWRVKGTEAWKEVVAESGRLRRVTLEGLEAGAVCEFQPMGGVEPGPVRTVTRVKGLAFGKARYGGTIRRDYDQRIPISVRNHGEKPLVVKLICEAPPAESKLLAGFIGEGSEGAPFTLAAGEEREFVLALSAQDCLSPHVTFPLRMASDSGFSDEAEVAVDVLLPVVKLLWEDAGPLPSGTGRLMRLKNKGDTLTDLTVGTANGDMGISPGINHGLFPAGHTLDFAVRPRLFEGFTQVTSAITAGAVARRIEEAVTVALPPGESVHRVRVAPTAATPEEAEATSLGALAGAYLNPNVVDWSQKPNPSDSDGDGRIDRWSTVDPVERVHWTGQDTDGDNVVDFVQADAGLDGQFDFSALRGKQGWEETNLAEAYLEMGFKLPYERSLYEKHDADIVWNGTVIGKMRDVIPEGNYSFRIPPSAMNFAPDGAPAENQVDIQSKHLRGGHYVVSSDFRVKLKLTGTDVFVTAKDQAEASQRVAATPGLTATVPDLSVSSADLRLPATLPEAGKPLTVSVPVRNMGAAAARNVEVALVRDSGGETVELGRTMVSEIPASGTVAVDITAPAPAGNVGIRVVTDPDNTLKDPDPDNNFAGTGVNIAGDKEKPEIALKSPAAGASLADAVVPIQVSASDKQGIARTEVRIDGGLWKKVPRATDGFAAKALLQPGARKITVRTVDVAGNAAEQTVDVNVTAKAPELTIARPQHSEEIKARSTEVELACGESAVAAAVRVNGGPWRSGEVINGKAVVEVPLQFGEALIEASAVDAKGVRTTASVPVRCSMQPGADDKPPPAAPAPPKLDVPGLGAVDPFGSPDIVIPAGPEAAAPAPAPGDAAPAPEAPVDDAAIADATLPPGDYDPATADELAEEEAAMGAADEPEMPMDDWLLDPEADWELPEEFAGPDLPEDPNWQPRDLESWDGYPVDGPEQEPAPEAPAFTPAAPPPSSAGGYVAVQQQQSDWYCTNRPNIGVKFQLPDWLKKLKLPKPGTPEFEAAFKKQMDKLKVSGVDTSGLEKFRDLLRNHCKRLDSPGELPTFLQSLGLTEMPKDDPVKLKEWRENMANAADAFVLRLLSSGDPALIQAGLKARAESLRQFDQATAEAASAAVDTIKANQKIVEDVAMTLPYANTAIGIVTLYTGETLSGEQLGPGSKVLNALFTLGPGVMKLFRNPSVRGTAAMIGNKAMWAGQKTISALASKLGMAGGRLSGAMKSMANGLGEARKYVGQIFRGRSDAAAAAFARTPAGRQAAQAAARDVAAGHMLLSKLRVAKETGNRLEYRRLIATLQGNKTAQRLLNTPGQYSNEFRNMLDKSHRAMQRLTDKRAIPEMLRSPEAQKEIQKLATKFGVKPGDIMIKARNISGNTKTLANVKPGELLKYGADRDVVFQYVTKDGRVLRDVHHGFSGQIYEKHLKSVTGFNMEQLDHVVTSRWNPEAYNPGFFAAGGNQGAQAAWRGQKIGEIISGKAAGHLQRGSDIRDTIIHKGKEWMERGDHYIKQGRQALGNQQMAEGMRQMGKEFTRQVKGVLESKGLKAAEAIPARLREGLRIFDQVQNGTYTVEQARAALAALTPKGGLPVTPQTIAEDLGYFVEFVNKWGVRAP